MKFQPQAKDYVHGTNFVFNSTGNNSNQEHWHKHFKGVLLLQDQKKKTTDRDDFPNWKILALLKWINHVGPKAWLLGRNISLGEMTMQCKGTHRDILQITYKAEGCSFQTDTLCQEGYCYQYYMRNQPAPQKYLNQGYSPLHSCVL